MKLKQTPKNQQMNKKNTFLAILWIVILIHFLKDITQDLLQIKSVLDVFGDAKENLTWLPVWAQSIYLYVFGGLSILAEITLLITIPISLFRKETNLTSKLIRYSFWYLLIFFSVAILLDPRFNPLY